LIQQRSSNHGSDTAEIVLLEAAINRNLNGLRGAFCARRRSPGVPEKPDPRADVNVKSFNVDASQNSPPNQVVPVRNIHAILIVDMQDIGRHARRHDPG